MFCKFNYEPFIEGIIVALPPYSTKKTVCKHTKRLQRERNDRRQTHLSMTLFKISTTHNYADTHTSFTNHS